MMFTALKKVVDKNSIGIGV